MLASRKSVHVPKAALRRVTTYVRELELNQVGPEEIVSSDQLAAMCAASPSQVRKDLAFLGEFGVRGKGYKIGAFLPSLRQALGVDRPWNTAVVGLGSQGRALLRRGQAQSHGFPIVAAFDCDPLKRGELVDGMAVSSMGELKEQVRRLDIRIGLLTTSPKGAQNAAEQLCEAGVKGLVNFTPVQLSVPAEVQVENVNLLGYFFSVAFAVTARQRETARKS